MLPVHARGPQLVVQDRHPEHATARKGHGKEGEVGRLARLFGAVQKGTGQFAEGGLGIHAQRAEEGNVVVGQSQNDTAKGVEQVGSVVPPHAVHRIHRKVAQRPQNRYALVQRPVARRVRRRRGNGKYAEENGTDIVQIVQGVPLVPGGRILADPPTVDVGGPPKQDQGPVER